MSVRKIAGLAAGFALVVGLIGSGVSAVFTDQVKAIENVNVGTFGCQIVASQPAGVVTGKTVTYDAPEIDSSAASSAPFAFTVKNTGSITAALQLSATALAAPFSDILATPVAPVILAGGASTTYSAGIQWSELGNTDTGKSVSITYTVNCGEVGTPTVSFYSTNRGTYDGLDSVRFAGSGSGFTPGHIITVKYAWDGAPAGGWDISLYPANDGELNNPTADASGSFVYWFADDCHDTAAVLHTTDQTVTVTATDGTHTATGTGILACSLML